MYKQHTYTLVCTIIYFNVKFEEGTHDTFILLQVHEIVPNYIYV